MPLRSGGLPSRSGPGWAQESIGAGVAGVGKPRLTRVWRGSRRVTASRQAPLGDRSQPVRRRSRWSLRERTIDRLRMAGASISAIFMRAARKSAADCCGATGLAWRRVAGVAGTRGGARRPGWPPPCWWCCRIRGSGEELASTCRRSAPAGSCWPGSWGHRSSGRGGRRNGLRA